MPLLNDLHRKLDYTSDAVDDIGGALMQKGVTQNLYRTPLAEWPPLITDAPGAAQIIRLKPSTPARLIPGFTVEKVV